MSGRIAIACVVAFVVVLLAYHWLLLITIAVGLGSAAATGRDAEAAAMRLAIADPPYPAFRGSGGTKQRSSRWYGDNQRSSTDRASDIHPDSRDWDDDDTHLALIERLTTEYDGWALATSPDGIRAYGPLPDGVRIMAWVKPNGQPGAHRLRSCWEPVLLFPPEGRRSNRDGRGQIPDVLTCPAPRTGFVGAKPDAWTRWVLAALCFDPALDTVDDLFPGSGAVAAAIAQGSLLDGAS